MRLAIHVRPGSRAVDVGGMHGDALIVRVRERREDGKATVAALAGLAAALGIPRQDVILVAGSTSRLKLVQVPDSAMERVAALRNAHDAR